MAIDEVRSACAEPPLKRDSDRRSGNHTERGRELVYPRSVLSSASQRLLEMKSLTPSRGFFFFHSFVEV